MPSSMPVMLSPNHYAVSLPDRPSFSLSFLSQVLIQSTISSILFQNIIAALGLALVSPSLWYSTCFYFPSSRHIFDSYTTSSGTPGYCLGTPRRLRLRKAPTGRIAADEIAMGGEGAMGKPGQLRNPKEPDPTSSRGWSAMPGLLRSR